MSKVAILKESQYRVENIVEDIKKLIDNTDFPLVKDKTVLIKTNLLSDSKPEKGITTHPSVIEALIINLKELGAKKILVGDSPGIQNSNFKPANSGIMDVIERTGAEWVDFTKETEERVVYKKVKVPIASCVFESDVVISAAKFKTHELMTSTGASKNMFGIIPSINKSKLHLAAKSPDEFAILILNLLKIRKPDWSIIDAIIGMEGSGPANGTLRPVGLLMASDNPLALDTSEAVIMGNRIESVPILKEACRKDPDSIKTDYTLLDARNLVIDDFKRINDDTKKGLMNSLVFPFLIRPFEKLFIKKNRTKPSFDSNKCKLCQKCLNICPKNALSIDKDKITLNAKECISCYCCSEICPFGAVIINK